MALYNEYNNTVQIHCSKFVSIRPLHESYTASNISLLSLKYSQQDATFFDLFISINCSTCFRLFLRPSSGAQNCTYSVRYCQNSTAACCYRGWDWM